MTVWSLWTAAHTDNEEESCSRQIKQTLTDIDMNESYMDLILSFWPKNYIPVM